MMTQEAPLETKRDEDFNKWYNEVVEKAGLCDKRYPVKGMNIWTPYGWKIMSLIDSIIRSEMERTGHGEVCFPMLIPEDQFAKEAEHIEGFFGEVFLVTHAGENKLEKRLILRPTSETAMYPIFNLWIRSHADLPLKVFQIVNTFRYETKQTRAFIRVREIHFFEAHTCHRDYEDAERQIKEDLEILANIMDALCLPYIVTRRPDWDKFAGAYYSLGVDTLMPNGRALQVGSIHQYKENFSRAYEITYEDENGEHKYVHQTTYGMSERLLGAIVGVHGDDKGLIIPPDVAPIQVVVVPIYTKETKEEVLEACRWCLSQLRDLRVYFDTSEDRPGVKYYRWELRGVPLRLEIGPRDVENRTVTLVRRDTGKRDEYPRDEVSKACMGLLKDIKKNLKRLAEKHFIEKTKSLSDLNEVINGINRAPWCGSEECAEQIEVTSEKSILGIKEEEEGDCIVCGKPTKEWVYFASTY